jgi:hypothetical protein
MMEIIMNKKPLNAVQGVHNFVSDTSDLSDAEIRENLISEGANVDSFLTRLGNEAQITSTQPISQQPSAAERLRALANRAGDGVKKLLGSASKIDEDATPSIAYGRTGKSRSSKSKKQNRTSKRRK